jgi:hypothetical protein
MAQIHLVKLLAVASLLAVGLQAPAAWAFNPDPRPTPTNPGDAAVCADDPTIACDPSNADACASATCIVDPTLRFSDVAVRGTLTLITDEDVSGWDEGTDASAQRSQNARFTLLLQYEHNGALHTFAETYQLGNVCAFGQELDPGVPFLCVPAVTAGWSQPAAEVVITSTQLNVVYTIPGDRVAKAIAAELTGDPNTTARPFLDIVDRLPETTSNHSADADPLASVQQLKVTIRLVP